MGAVEYEKGVRKHAKGVPENDFGVTENGKGALENGFPGWKNETGAAGNEIPAPENQMGASVKDWEAAGGATVWRKTRRLCAVAVARLPKSQFINNTTSFR